MRDGVRLATVVHFPSGVRPPYPVILLRTPYNKAWLEDYGSYYSRHGYAVAIQDDSDPKGGGNRSSMKRMTVMTQSSGLHPKNGPRVRLE